MKILEEENLEKGLPFQVDLTDEEIDTLIVVGFQSMIEEMDLPIVAKKVSKDVKLNNTHNLSPEELAVIVNIGFNKVLKDAMESQIEDSQLRGSSES